MPAVSADTVALPRIPTVYPTGPPTARWSR